MVGGRAYWSNQQLLTGLVSALLLIWGLVWVLQVTSYGICGRQVQEIVGRMERKEMHLAHDSMSQQADMYQYMAAMLKVQEDADTAQRILQHRRVPLVVPCTAIHLDTVPTLFAIHAVTSKELLESCEKRISKHLHDVYKIEVIDTPGMAGLMQGVQAVVRKYAYPMQHVAVMEEGTAVSADGFAFLHAVAEQAVLATRDDEPSEAGGSDLSFASCGMQSDPIFPQKASGSGLGIPPLMELMIVKREAVPSGVFVFPVKGVHSFVDSVLEKRDLPAILPLLPRAGSSAEDLVSAAAHADYIHPVHFASVDLSYLQTDVDYLRHIRACAKQVWFEICILKRKGNNIYYYREFIFQYFTHRWKQPEGKHFFPRAKPEGKNASPRAVSTCK